MAGFFGFPLYETEKLLYNIHTVCKGVALLKCMRCGKDTEDRAVFCPECLADMERHPVKPGTIIRIPVRQEHDTRKPTKKNWDLSLEEQLEAVQNLAQLLFVTVLGLLGALIITGALLLHFLSQPQELPEDTQPVSGRNYTLTIPAEDD